MEKEKYVCPPGHSWSLDNFIRNWIHNPEKIFGKYIREGMTILDLGCGPGFFTLHFAQKAGVSGRVIAADLQEEMLEKVRRKIDGTRFETRIFIHKCMEESIGFNGKVDFVNAFYMVHEVPDARKLIQEIHGLLNPGGIFFFCEPKFHVSKKEFLETVEFAGSIGFRTIEQPSIFMSRTVVFAKG